MINIVKEGEMPKMICEYCGNKTKIVMMSGREGCSYCGAGIEESNIEIDVFEEEKLFEKKAVDKRGRKGVLSFERMFAYGIVLMLLALIFTPYINNTIGEPIIAFSEPPSDYINVIEVNLCVDLIDGYTGEYNNYEAMIEIYNFKIELMYVFVMRNTAMFSLILEESKVYEVWIYPYLNATVFVDGFMAVANETQLVVFPVY